MDIASVKREVRCKRGYRNKVCGAAGGNSYTTLVPNSTLKFFINFSFVYIFLSDFFTLYFNKNQIRDQNNIPQNEQICLILNSHSLIWKRFSLFILYPNEFDLNEKITFNN